MEERREQLRRQWQETARLLSGLEALESVPSGFNRFNAAEQLRWTLEAIEFELAFLDREGPQGSPHDL